MSSGGCGVVDKHVQNNLTTLIHVLLVNPSRVILMMSGRPSVDSKEFAAPVNDPRVPFIIQGQTYFISGRAQAVLSDVVESILEECLQDAKNSATAAGKSCVTPEEMEKALRKLCLRLNAQPSTPSKQKVNTQHEDA